MMRVLGVLALGCVLAFGAVEGLALSGVEGQPASPDRAEIDRAVDRVRPSLVRIHVVAVEYDQGREIKREGAGSGTIITPEGHVLTNHHVAGRTRLIVCTLPSKEEIDADVVGTDPLSDITVVKLRPAKPRVFPVATFGDSSTLKVGDRVLALGSPFALSQSVTLGIISNTEMIMPALFWPFNRLRLEGEDVGSIVRWIAHDAAIYGGNSGGPLINLKGEIVGVNEISLGLAGAIPGNLAREVGFAIIRDGRVARSWIGLEAQPLLRSSTKDRGVLVSGTIAGSPAATAGFQAGDVLLRLGGEDVNVRFAEELPLFNQLVMRLPRGKKVEAVVLRGAETKTLAVVPEDRESIESRPREIGEWGIAASDLTTWSMKTMRRTSRDGVRIRGIRPGGPADDAKPALQEDDVIVKMDDTDLRRVDDLIAATEKLKLGEDPREVLVTFDRGRDRFLTVVELGRPGLEDPGAEARKAWVPVSIQVLTRELAAKLGLEGKSGVRVTRVERESARKAGLEVGDVIVAVDDEPVRATQPADVEVFPAMIRQYKIGGTAVLTVVRGHDERKVPVTLEMSPRLPREMRKYQDDNFEFRVRDLAPDDREETGVPEKEGGVLVDAVSEGGWAALARLAVGDVILTIDGDGVRDVRDVQTKMLEVTKNKAPVTIFHVRRGIRTLFVEVQPSWSR
ncbi:MAG TPA: PDZ domain-containing protein [Vicinamibacterales bacterium]|jgi:serine protease Do|nr:PDZ domain-containing protein [Vicinamibacterales bacterium]